MSQVVKGIRETSSRSLWLDSGDSFQGAPVFNKWHGEVEMRTLSLMGMDAAVVGNHEFDLGTQNLVEQIQDWAQFPLLAGNYLYDDPIDPTEVSLRDVVQPYVIFDLDGLRVGVIGMGNHSSMTGILEGGNSLGIRPREDGPVVEELVRLIRPVVDVVVVLSHLGLEEDEGLGSHQVDDRNEQLPLEGVDVILGGHLHITLNPPKTLESDDFGNRTVLSHSGAFAKYVGRLDVVVRVGDDQTDPERRSKVTAFSYQQLPLTNKIGPVNGPYEDAPVDVDIVDFLWPYSVEINREIDLDGVFAYTDGGRILRNNITGGDSQLGNLVARSMQIRTGVEADFALTNSLGIRADFEAGPLTIEQMFNVFPFENSITVMFLSGSEVQEMLDFVARRSASRGCRTQAQVAGIWWDMVCSGDCPDGRSACAKNIVIGENCRGGDPAGPNRPQRLRAARAHRSVQGGGQRLHRPRRLRLRGPRAKHLQAGHRGAAARGAGRFLARPDPVRRFGRRRHQRDGRDRHLRRHRLPRFRPSSRPTGGFVRYSSSLVAASVAVLSGCVEQLPPIEGTTSLRVEVISPTNLGSGRVAAARRRPLADHQRPRARRPGRDRHRVQQHGVVLRAVSRQPDPGAGHPARDGDAAERRRRERHAPAAAGVRPDVSLGRGRRRRRRDLRHRNQPHLVLPRPVPRGRLAAARRDVARRAVRLAARGKAGGDQPVPPRGQRQVDRDRVLRPGLHRLGRLVPGRQRHPAVHRRALRFDLRVLVLPPRERKKKFGFTIFAGQFVDSIGGAISEFNGLTEVGFPTTTAANTDDNSASLPEPALIQANFLTSQTIELERLEAALVAVEGATLCPLGEAFETFGQWSLDVGNGCDTSDSVAAISAGVVPEFDPTQFVGQVFPRVVGTLRPVNIDTGFNVWIIHPRSMSDISLP